MELGPIQKQWIQGLKDNQQLQAPTCLGKLQDGVLIGACCLGYLHYINTQETANDSVCDATDFGYLYTSFEKYGLNDHKGVLKQPVLINGRVFSSLALMNDATPGLDWFEIAEYIEANPDNVFTKSV